MKLITLIFTASILFMCIANISAAGIQVINNQSVLYFNKTYGVAQDFNIQIRNMESYSFYNVTIEKEGLINKVIIPRIDSGQLYDVTLNIITNETLNSNIKIKGFYLSTIGASNATHNVNVDFTEGLDKCDFTIIKGDKVIWSSNIADEIVLKNENTQNNVATIQANSNYTTHFQSPESFKYSFLRRGYRFTDVCIITALDDSGYVNDPNMDGNFSISVSTSYKPTNLQMNLIDANFSMEFIGSSDGALTLKNTGSEIAKNIILTSDWMTFSRNNFDLAVNEQKSVIFTIRPQIGQTSDTNKSYIKNITVFGNFPTLVYPVEVFVKYAEISADGTINGTNRSTIVDLICAERPDLCNPAERIIYRDLGNNSDGEFNVTFQENQVKDMFAYLFELGDTLNLVTNYVKQTQQNNTDSSLEMKKQIDTLKASIEADKIARESSNDNNNFAILVLSLSTVAILLFIIIWQYRRIRLVESIDRM